MKNKVVICMGSSCFARGNEKNLQILESYLLEKGLRADVELSGSCCEGQCAMGPNIVVNGEIFHKVDKEALIDILNTKLG